MSNTASLIFYLLSFSTAALLMYYGFKRSNKVIVGMSLAIPMLVGALRYGVGTDYTTYVAIYDQLSQLSLPQYLSLQSLDVEIGFYLLVQISSFLTGNYLLLFAISSFLTVYFFYLGLKKYDIRQKASVYFLYLTIVFPFSFNSVRQGIAISICFYAFSFIIERVPKKYLLWILAASVFHKSALFLLPFYFINRFVKKNKKGKYNFILVKSLLLAMGIYLVLPYMYELLQTLSVFDKYSAYQTIIAEGNNYIFYLKIALLGIILLFYKRITAFNEINIYFLIFFILDIVLSTLGFASPFVKRIALYFSLFSPLLLFAIPDVFSDRLGKFISYALLLLYGVVYFYLAFYVMGQSDIMPYRFIPWSGI